MNNVKEKDRIYRPYTLDRSGMRRPISLLECATFRAWGCLDELRDASRWGRQASWLFVLHLSYFAMHCVNRVFPFLLVNGLEEWRRTREESFQLSGRSLGSLSLKHNAKNQPVAAVDSESENTQ